jgi:hypothetical protein
VTSGARRWRPAGRWSATRGPRMARGTTTSATRRVCGSARKWRLPSTTESTTRVRRRRLEGEK